jgi:hypothetical protein
MCHCGSHFQRRTRAVESEGSSRRITTMTATFMSTREYQCDQPSSLAFGRFDPRA